MPKPPFIVLITGEHRDILGSGARIELVMAGNRAVELAVSGDTITLTEVRDGIICLEEKTSTRIVLSSE